MKSNMLFPVLLLAILAGPVTIVAQKAPADWPKHEVVIGGGVSQLLLGGGNLQVDYYTGRWSFDYSHGFNLQFEGSVLTDEQEAQQLNLRMPWTTGFGVGYRVTRHFSVRIEPKLHKFELHYDGSDYNNSIADYTTFTLGVGAYYRWLPFEKSQGFARGITVMPSVRFWPNISSSLDGDKLTYQNQRTGKQEVHEAAEQGVGGFFANVTIGYTLTSKKTRGGN